MLLALQLNNLLEDAGDPGDTTPDQFTFTDQTGVALSSTITSAPVTITGIDAAADITVSGGTYSINGGAFTASAGTVVNGDQVRARNTSSGSYSTAVNTVVTIGGVSDTFTSTTTVDPGVFTGAGYVGGTAVSAAGVMGTDFLNDATAVPNDAYFINGIAHTAAGLRYVALWPASDVAFYHGGIARRTDGAMLILPGGTIAAYRAGWALTARGEVVAVVGTPDVIHGGFGLLNDGTVCMSEVS